MSRGPRGHAGVLVWGFGAAALYLFAVIASQRAGLAPLLPLYDGLAPTSPYQWVNPPAEFRADNRPALAGAGTIAFTREGSDPASVTTGDGQVAAIFPIYGIQAAAGETAVKVTITPLDPATSVPESLRAIASGNAYRIEAVYAGSGTPVPLVKRATILMRYPLHANEMWRSGDPNWVTLPATVFPTTLQLFAETPTLGVFLLTGPPQGRTLWQRLRVQSPGTLIGALIGLVVLLGYALIFFLGRTRRRR